MTTEIIEDDEAAWGAVEGRSRFIMRPLRRLNVPIALPIDGAGIKEAARQIKASGWRVVHEHTLNHGDPRVAAELRALLDRKAA